MPDYVMDLRKYVGNKPLLVCGANVILLDNHNRILLHHRRDNDTWGLPGGCTELGEKVETTACREVYEEVGLTCENLSLFNVYSGEELYYKYPSGDEVYNITVTYLCSDFHGVIDVDPTEGKDARFFNVDEIPDKISPPVKIIIEDFLDRYNKVVNNFI